MSAIVKAPDNTLVVRCEDKYGNMTCKSDREDETAWTYDGNPVIDSPCRSNEPLVFEANPVDKYTCNIGALLEGARLDRSIQRISGPYGCTDRNNDGRTHTSVLIVLGKPTLAFGILDFPNDMQKKLLSLRHDVRAINHYHFVYGTVVQNLVRTMTQDNKNLTHSHAKTR